MKQPGAFAGGGAERWRSGPLHGDGLGQPVEREQCDNVALWREGFLEETLWNSQGRLNHVSLRSQGKECHTEHKLRVDVDVYSVKVHFDNFVWDSEGHVNYVSVRSLGAKGPSRNKIRRGRGLRRHARHGRDRRL